MVRRKRRPAVKKRGRPSRQKRNNDNTGVLAVIMVAIILGLFIFLTTPRRGAVKVPLKPPASAEAVLKPTALPVSREPAAVKAIAAPVVIKPSGAPKEVELKMPASLPKIELAPAAPKAEPLLSARVEPAISKETALPPKPVVPPKLVTSPKSLKPVVLPKPVTQPKPPKPVVLLKPVVPPKPVTPLKPPKPVVPPKPVTQPKLSKLVVPPKPVMQPKPAAPKTQPPRTFMQKLFAPAPVKPPVPKPVKPKPVIVKTVAPQAVVMKPAVPKPEAAKPAVLPRPVLPAALPSRPARMQIAIVIDDWGYNPDLVDMLDPKYPVTCAVLPNLNYSRQVSDKLHAKGFEIILHLPMEPRERLNLENDTILTSMGESQVQKILDGDLKALPYAKGVNNHMGSLATADSKVMEAIYKSLNKKGLYFLDSSTASGSLCPELAPEFGIRFARRNVFIDNSSEPSYIKGQIRAAALIARNFGRAVGIGHARINTLEALKETMPELEKEGYSFVFVSELVR